MISREQAEHAQQTLGESLNYPRWLRGIGIMHDPEGSHFLKVNVQSLTDEVRAAIPSEVEGVPVQVRVVGTFQPHDGKPAVRTLLGRQGGLRGVRSRADEADGWSKT